MEGMAPKGASQPTAFEPGTIIDDRYELLEMLRHGPAGIVYAARGIFVDRPVTLTILSSGKGCEVPRCGERDFLRSAQAASEFDHPNVVTIRDFGFADSSRRCYLVRDKLTGTTLAQEIHDNGALEIERLFDLMIPCIDALAEGHDTGLVHGHLSPASIWLAHPGEEREALRLIDFGVPCVDACDCGDATHATHGVSYPSAEPDNKGPSMWADAYQVALVMLEALSGREITWRLEVGEGGVLRPEVPEEIAQTPLGAVISRALSTNSEARFADGAALAKALISARRGEPLKALSGEAAA